jgi:protein arginine N-methyltransferase 1
MYDTRAFGSMIGDTVRMRAYAGALRAAVRPGDVALDIGTGTGIFALLACQYGARRVYAIEPNDNIQVARTLARENGFSDRIEFIQDLSTNIRLDEKADVIVSDLRGLLPLLGKHIPALADARERLLKPGGVLIPNRDTLHVCVVEAPDLYKGFSDPWAFNPYELDLEKARLLTVNTWSHGKASTEQMLTPGECWARLDYSRQENPDVRGDVTLPVLREGTGHGLLVWFNTELLDGYGFSNAPDSPERAEVYGSGFFPFLRPVEVAATDQAHIELSAVLVNDAYTWRWNTQIRSGEGEVKASYEQSTFYGTVFSKEKLRKRRPDHVPALNDEGVIEHFLYSEMDGTRSLGVIAADLFNRFPGQFASLQEAIERVGDTSQKYSK